MTKETKATETEEVVEPTEEVEEEEQEEQEDTVEAIKAKAEALEAEIKALSENQKEAEIKTNQLRRLEKAEEKLARLKGEAEPKESKADLEVRDLLTLAKADIPEDSEKAKILERYRKGGLIANYAEGLTHRGVLAEFQALDEQNEAKAVIDESDSEEYLKTKQEIVTSYRASGEVPKDPAMRTAIVEDNLKQMGL